MRADPEDDPEAGRSTLGTVLAESWGDVRQAMRQFRRRPGFTALGVATLVLGLGATVALGSVVRAVLLRPLPVPDEAAVRVFWYDYAWTGVEFDHVRERTRAFSLAAYTTSGVSFRGETTTSMLIAGVASAELFEVLGARPALGRTFRAGEDRPGAEPVAVLSHAMWETLLGRDPEVIGRRIVVDGEPVTVVGVMPRGFFFPTPEHRLWRPLTLDPASGRYHNTGWLTLVGRVKPGLSEAQVADDISGIARALGERFQYPAAWDKTQGAHARPLRAYVLGEAGPGLVLLGGAGLLILVMACANVAALVLARTTDRSREIALRAALGAGRARLARQVVAEALVLTGIGGMLAAVAAALGFKALVASLPLANGLAETVSLDWTMLVMALGGAVAVGLLVAAAPVRALLLGRLQGIAGERAVRGLGRRPSRFYGALVATEAAVAVVLVVGAGLLIRSVEHLYSLDLGFEPRNVTAIDLLATATDLAPSDRERFFADVVEQATAVPGVLSAGLVPRLPIRDGGDQGTVAILGRPDLEGPNAPNSLFRPVTPDYFATLGIPIIRGRGITPLDRRGTDRVVVVSRSFAELAWPGQDPIGRQVVSSSLGPSHGLTVVGVVGDIRSTSVTGANPLAMYLPLAQLPEPSDGMVLVVRTAPGVGAPVAAIRDLVQRLDRRVAIGRVMDMETVIATALAEPLRLRFFLTLFASLALVLGVVGIYSVVSYAVVRRRSEFGVRMALGAEPARVLRQVIGRGLVPVALGTGVGVVLALVFARVAARFLFGVSPSDPLSLAAAVAALMAAGVGASVIPAVRAARVNPVEALRAN